MMKPNTALMAAATSDALKVSRYDASARGSVAIRQNSGSGKLAPFITSAAIGTSTITARNMPEKPSVSPKPGSTLGLTQPLAAAMVQPLAACALHEPIIATIPTPRRRRFDRRRRRH